MKKLSCSEFSIVVKYNNEIDLYFHILSKQVIRQRLLTTLVDLIMNLRMVACITVFIVQLASAAKCKIFETGNQEFFPLRHCQRSNKSVIAFFNVDELENCAKLARSVRGLAFNFSPKNRLKINLYDNESYESYQRIDNCEVLECPEYQNFTSMVNDSRYDYYSLYSSPPREFR